MVNTVNLDATIIHTITYFPTKSFHHELMEWTLPSLYLDTSTVTIGGIRQKLKSDRVDPDEVAVTVHGFIS